MKKGRNKEGSEGERKGGRKAVYGAYFYSAFSMCFSSKGSCLFQFQN